MRRAYRGLASAAAPGRSGDPDLAGDLVLGLVESVIAMRRDLPGLAPAEELGPAVAAAALRLVGATPPPA